MERRREMKRRRMQVVLREAFLRDGALRVVLAGRKVSGVWLKCAELQLVARRDEAFVLVLAAAIFNWRIPYKRPERKRSMGRMRLTALHQHVLILSAMRLWSEVVELHRAKSNEGGLARPTPWCVNNSTRTRGPVFSPQTSLFAPTTAQHSELHQWIIPLLSTDPPSITSLP